MRRRMSSEPAPPLPPHPPRPPCAGDAGAGGFRSGMQGRKEARKKKAGGAGRILNIDNLPPQSSSPGGGAGDRQEGGGDDVSSLGSRFSLSSLGTECSRTSLSSLIASSIAGGDNSVDGRSVCNSVRGREHIKRIRRSAERAIDSALRMGGRSRLQGKKKARKKKTTTGGAADRILNIDNLPPPSPSPGGGPGDRQDGRGDDVSSLGSLMSLSSMGSHYSRASLSSLITASITGTGSNVDGRSVRGGEQMKRTRRSAERGTESAMRKGGRSGHQGKKKGIDNLPHRLPSPTDIQDGEGDDMSSLGSVSRTSLPSLGSERSRITGSGKKMQRIRRSAERGTESATRKGAGGEVGPLNPHTLRNKQYLAEESARAFERGLKYVRKGKYDKAREKFRTTLKARILLHGHARHTSIAPVHEMLGHIEMKRDDMNQAALHYRAALAIIDAELLGKSEGEWADANRRIANRIRQSLESCKKPCKLDAVEEVGEEEEEEHSRASSGRGGKSRESGGSGSTKSLRKKRVAARVRKQRVAALSAFALVAF